jgi:hypothetical protein
MVDDPNPLEDLLRFHAEKFRNAPGALHLARLARTAKRIPGPLLDDLASLILRLDDVPLVGNDIFVHLLEISHCDGRCADATEFATALKMRLQRYVDDPRVASDARGSFRERVGWSRMALGRAFELRKWPAIILAE